jgi:molybdopterin-guanine dinucleotide biosynthesis protein A
VSHDAIVLAGGRGSRLGGVVKPAVSVGGRRLLDIALAAVAGARRVVVVGDVPVPDGVLRTREDPPFGGPVAGVDAGFAALAADRRAPWTVLLASDLPDAEAAVATLLASRPGPAYDGACLVDTDGRLQWLLGRYRTEALAGRLARRGDPPVTAMWRLLGPLRLLGVDPGAVDVADLDTPADAERWARRRGAVEW